LSRQKPRNLPMSGWVWKGLPLSALEDGFSGAGYSKFADTGALCISLVFQEFSSLFCSYISTYIKSIGTMSFFADPQSPLPLFLPAYSRWQKNSILLFVGCSG